MAAIFAQSAWHALRDPAQHEAVVAGYRLLPGWAVRPAAWGLPVLSGVAALLLLVPATAVTGAVLGLGLMGVFTAAIGVNVRRGRVDIDCGCGAASGQRISGALLTRNFVLAGALGCASLAPRGGIVDGLTLLSVLGGAGGATALYFAAGQLLANRAVLRA
jgi:hypothetical protein